MGRSSAMQRQEEERRLDKVAQLNQEISDEISERCLAIVEKIESSDGIVIESFEDEDSLVSHIEDAKATRIKRPA
jgi:hypothetical protein